MLNSDMSLFAAHLINNRSNQQYRAGSTHGLVNMALDWKSGDPWSVSGSATHLLCDLGKVTLHLFPLPPCDCLVSLDCKFFGAESLSCYVFVVSNIISVGAFRGMATLQLKIHG